MASSSSFPGFPPEALAFLRGLKKNNNRDWFNARKPLFEDKVRGPMIDLVRAVHSSMVRYAPEYVGADPAKCVFRIYRDTRFSKDKTPYKTYVSAWFCRNGLGKDQGAGFYFYVSPDETGVAGGLYQPGPDELLLVRRMIADDADSFRPLFENRRVKKLFGELGGARLTRPPKGFDPDHPDIEMLKHKSLVLHTTLDPALAATPNLLKEITTRFRGNRAFCRISESAAGRKLEEEAS